MFHSSRHARSADECHQRGPALMHMTMTGSMLLEQCCPGQQLRTMRNLSPMGCIMTRLQLQLQLVPDCMVDCQMHWANAHALQSARFAAPARVACTGEAQLHCQSFQLFQLFEVACHSVAAGASPLLYLKHRRSRAWIL